MNEMCPRCDNDTYEILNTDSDTEINSVTIYLTCRCEKCNQFFRIVREYKLDPYYSYVEEIEE
jgi:uncharacterized protein YbaR (Trm112 family)